MKKFLVVLVSLIFIFSGFILYDSFSKDKIAVLDIEKEIVDVDELYIYGTHLNIGGSYQFEETPVLVLYNGEFIDYKIITSNKSFTISEEINNGIYLDEIPIGDYYLFLRTEYIDGDETKYKYYSLKNNTEYPETVYYTMKNIDHKIIINNEDSYPTMMLHVNENTDKNVYDIVLDPGHGGMDGGATRFGYKETDFTMTIANKLKKSLEDVGFRVKLTYEEGELSSNERLEEYGPHGRAVIPREVNAKYLFSIHLNSNSSASVSGLEIYAAKNINYDFAKILVDNITTHSGLASSNNKINKVLDGIYSRTFSEDDIQESLDGYEKRELIPYDITTKSNYYYIIRETGGIVTGAYVDDRNNDILGNPYVKSNVGTEAYLLELGYISNKNNLDNLNNNMDNYILGITNAIKTIYKTAE